MSMRLKLDRCGVKLSLDQWRQLPKPLRESLLEVPLASAQYDGRIAQLLRRHGQRLGWAELPVVPAHALDERSAIEVPRAVTARWMVDGQGR